MKKLCDTDLWIPDTDIHFEYLNTKSPVKNYQHDRIDEVIKICSGFDLAVDIGAHIGLVSIYLAKYFKQVYAYEPCPKIFECLEKNVPENVSCFQIALGKKRSRVGIGYHPRNTGQTILIRGNTVDQIPLDELDIDKIDFIKVDVQGYEYWVLKGARLTIAKYHPVVMLEEEEYNRFAKVRQAFQFMLSLGYRCIKRIKSDYIMVYYG